APRPDRPDAPPRNRADHPALRRCPTLRGPAGAACHPDWTPRHARRSSNNSCAADRPTTPTQTFGLAAVAQPDQTGQPPDPATPPTSPTMALPLRCGPRPPHDLLTSTQPRRIKRWPPSIRDQHTEDHDLRLEY